MVFQTLTEIKIIKIIFQTSINSQNVVKIPTLKISKCLKNYSKPK